MFSLGSDEFWHQRVHITVEESDHCLNKGDVSFIEHNSSTWPKQWDVNSGDLLLHMVKEDLQKYWERASGWIWRITLVMRRWGVDEPTESPMNRSLDFKFISSWDVIIPTLIHHELLPVCPFSKWSALEIRTRSDLVSVGDILYWSKVHSFMVTVIDNN